MGAMGRVHPQICVPTLLPDSGVLLGVDRRQLSTRLLCVSQLCIPDHDGGQSHQSSVENGGEVGALGEYFVQSLLSIQFHQL